MSFFKEFSPVALVDSNSNNVCRLSIRNVSFAGIYIRCVGVNFVIHGACFKYVAFMLCW